MIVTFKEWVPKTFEDKLNQYLSEGYEILNTACGLEGNTDGNDMVFAAILHKGEDAE